MTLLLFVLRQSNMPGTHLCQQTIQEVITEGESLWGKCHRRVYFHAVPGALAGLWLSTSQATSEGDQVLKLTYQRDLKELPAVEAGDVVQ